MLDDGALQLDEGALVQALQQPTPFVLNLPEAPPAAVLVAVRLKPARALIQVRSQHLREHAGELCFPGGKPEPHDRDLLATALREACEETGLPLESLRPLGALARMPVITGRFILHPFVALLDRAPPTSAPSAEQERLIEVPLAPWIDGRSTVEGTRSTWQGGTFVVPFFRFEGGEVLYGASAFIFYDLLVRLARSQGLAAPRIVESDWRPWGWRYGDSS